MKKSANSDKTRSSLYWNLTLKVPYEVFRFGTSLVVARILEPRDFGIVSIATMLIYYANTITNMGFNQALVQRKDVDARHVDSVFFVDFVISVFLALLFYFLAPYIAGFFNSPESSTVIRVLSMIFVLTALHDIPYTLFRRDIDFKTISIVDITKEFCISLLTLGLAVAGFNYWAIVWGQLIPMFFATFYLIYRSGWRPKLKYDHQAIRDLFNFGAWSFFRSQALFFSSRADRLVIGRAMDPSVLGLYDKAKSLYQMPMDSIASNINTVLFSSFSRSQQSTEQLRRMLFKGFLVISIITFPIYAGFHAVANHFIIVLLGQKWSAAIRPLEVLCLGGFFASFNGLISTFVIGSGKYKRYSVALFAGAFLLFLLSVLFVPYGISYVAIAVLAYSIVLFVVGLVIIRYIIDFSWADLLRHTMPAASGCVFMYLVIWACLGTYFAEATFLNLSALVAIGAVAYCSWLMLVPSAVLKEMRSSVFSDLAIFLMKFKNIRN